jgi:signal transduction histidine kinase
MKKNEIEKNKFQLLGRMFADLMHEVRNPLSVLRINFDLLENSDCEKDKDFPEIVHNGKEAIAIIENIIAQTMDFVRGNGEDDSFEHCSVNLIAQQAYDFVKFQAKKKGIKLHKNLSEENVRIIANKNQMVQVLLNLLTNAFEAVQENAQVSLKTFVEGEYVYFEVADNGHGIQKEHEGKIFEKFFTTKESGVGIGLAVTKEILDKHNAEIFIESEVGKGAKFIVKFKYSKE